MKNMKQCKFSHKLLDVSVFVFKSWFVCSWMAEWWKCLLKLVEATCSELQYFPHKYNKCKSASSVLFSGLVVFFVFTLFCRWQKRFLITNHVCFVIYNGYIAKLIKNIVNNKKTWFVIKNVINNKKNQKNIIFETYGKKTKFFFVSLENHVFFVFFVFYKVFERISWFFLFFRRFLNAFHVVSLLFTMFLNAFHVFSLLFKWFWITIVIRQMCSTLFYVQLTMFVNLQLWFQLYFRMVVYANFKFGCNNAICWFLHKNIGKYSYFLKMHRRTMLFRIKSLRKKVGQWGGDT